ncbi:nitrate reductase [Ramlibacter tataouinensis]|uniref:Candidate molybdopterin oxidoreductase n=1 Tax=Ramlibacter tataouinensis (strain ATCC BAA-407 / DSM 14655 / LMG 21543 / TTB310) TaxID=365046 RepID=F5Y4B7_RAMTT|nr:nitrate reductase [Ramlibacter tataouinensis]AEG93764.1 Candidate molybdopterin oxidoreductase [Ramlibacter tataouinensis TTB310]
MKEVRSTCPYCGVGCGVIIESQGERITGVRGDPEHPANFGRLCSKGSTLHLTASAEVVRQTRLLQPMRRLQRGAAPQPLPWDDALQLAADRFAGTIARHGPDAVGFYVSGQLLTEDYYVFNKLAKGLVGSNNIDTNSRLCMSSAVAGYKLTLGADAPPACYDDVNHAGCLFIAGSNAAWAHPVLFRRIEQAKAANPAMRIVLVDPRRTDTAELADLHLPVQPGTDVMLFNGLLHLMLWEGWTDTSWIATHTTGFEALRATVRDCTPQRVSQVCGVPQDDLLTAARWFATGASGEPQHRAGTLSLYCQGLNQSTSGTDKNAALINLHLACGQIGKPGAGPFSLTGQPNAMGGREVGGLANLLSAHRDLANPQHRAEVAALWGVPSVPDQPGKTAVELFQAAADGEVKALWIACTNPAQSLPDQATVRRALERAEFVVVQEAFATPASCDFADLLLPASTWGEKTGTVTNSERRISRVRAAVPPPGQARHDWRIVVDFARRLEALLPPPPGGRSKTLFPYEDPEAIWNEHRESTRGRDLDITGLSYALLDNPGPQQWPMPQGAPAGKARLYEDGVFPTPDGRARFADVAWRPVAEPRESRYPFSLTTGRLRDQWHGMSRSGTVARLFGHVPEPVVQLHPQDMHRRGLAEGDLVHVTSKRGSIVVPVQASRELGLGQAFMAMHWGGEYLGGSSSTGARLAGVNALTTSAFCPTSKQPELKHAAVKILKAELPWSLLAAAWLPEDQALAAREQARALMDAFPFASCVPFSSGAPAAGTAVGERCGLLFRAAAHEAPPEALLQRLEALFGLAGGEALRYADARRGQRRAVRLARVGQGTRLEGFLLAGDTRAEAWIKALLQDGLPAQAYGRQLLLAGPRPPVATAARGRPVCTCLNVTDAQIDGCLADLAGAEGDRLQALQARLHCGTQCGSCLPELRRRVRQLAAPSFAK